MILPLRSAAFIVMVASLSAQTTFTTPKGYLATPGTYQGIHNVVSHASPLYSNVLYQVTDPDMPSGKSVLTRMDWRTTKAYSYSPGTGLGRTFSKLTLRLGHAVTKLTSRHSRNWSGAATTVFSSRFSIPSVTSGIPKQVWGNCGSFPFKNAHVFDSNKGELLQEWAHNGGTFANGHTYALLYRMDGVPRAHVTSVQPAANPNLRENRFLPKHPTFGTGLCRDSDYPSNAPGAQAVLMFSVYGDRHPTTSLRGKMQVNAASTLYTAHGAPIVAAVTLGTIDAGVNVGAGCNKLYLNMAAPLAVVARTSGYVRSNGWTNFAVPGQLSRTKLVQWRPAYVGAVLGFQAAWNDTKSKAFSLTVATRLVIPKLPATPRVAQEAVALTFKGTVRPSYAGEIGYSRALTRYTRK